MAKSAPERRSITLTVLVWLSMLAGTAGAIMLILGLTSKTNTTVDLFGNQVSTDSTAVVLMVVGYVVAVTVGIRQPDRLPWADPRASRRGWRKAVAIQFLGCVQFVALVALVFVAIVVFQLSWGRLALAAVGVVLYGVLVGLGRVVLHVALEPILSRRTK